MTLHYGHRPVPDPETLRCRMCGRPTAIQAFLNVIRHVRWTGPLCDAPMRYGERCARQVGHARDSRGSGHKTRYALDNANVTRRAAA
jgi:hypothetical protein